LRFRVLEEIKQLTSKTQGAEIVTSDRVEKNHHVTGAAGRDIETPLIRRFCEGTDSFVAGSDKRQKHDVSLVALETVGIAAD
jgi:hypothetical protein